MTALYLRMATSRQQLLELSWRRKVCASPFTTQYHFSTLFTELFCEISKSHSDECFPNIYVQATSSTLDIHLTWSALSALYGTLLSRRISWTFLLWMLGSWTKGTAIWTGHISLYFIGDSFLSNNSLKMTNPYIPLLEFISRIMSYSLWSLSVIACRRHIYLIICIPYPVYLYSAYRHYGALQGLDKQATVDKYGKDQVNVWRR